MMNQKQTEDNNLEVEKRSHLERSLRVKRVCCNYLATEKIQNDKLISDWGKQSSSTEFSGCW